MSQVQANFEFEDDEYQSVVIPCTPKKKIGEVIDSFKNKVKNDIEIKDYLFFNKKKEINPESTISDFQKVSKSIITITVRKRTKITKCPDCVANTCFVEIVNYGLHFYGCPNKHDIIKTFDQYEDSQYINYDRVKCDKCKNTKAEVKEMHKCLTCSKKNKASYYICNKCLNSHNKQGDKQQHKTIEYDNKNYFCLDGSEYSSFCETCKIDLCKICEKKHANHKIIKYDDITPKIKERQRELTEIKRKIEDSKACINQILKIIDNAYDILDNYYKICNDILDKYDSYNSTLRNYHIIQNINFLEKSNKEIIKHLDYLIKEDDCKDTYFGKCGILIDIYYKERKNYAGENIIDDDIPQRKEVFQSESNNNIQKSSKEKKNGRSIINKPQ